MKIALIGYGKMGHAVEQVALHRGHTIALAIDSPDDWSLQADHLNTCDVAIEFSMPDVAPVNIRRCLAAGIPTVSGTTGWYSQLDAIKSECADLNGTLFVASNFSIGMNIVFALNRTLARLSAHLGSYHTSINETHHIHKLDAPSGTAIQLANDIIAQHSSGSWFLVSDDDSSTHNSSDIPIRSLRIGEVPGVHEVVYDGQFDTITLSHSAKSRTGLAQGAVLAAEFIKGKKGFFSMDDLLAL